MKIIIPLCTFLTLVGCTTFTPPAHQKELKEQFGLLMMLVVQGYDSSPYINTDTPYRFSVQSQFLMWL